jgi:hypothetical protein
VHQWLLDCLASAPAETAANTHSVAVRSHTALRYAVMMDVCVCRLRFTDERLTLARVSSSTSLTHSLHFGCPHLPLLCTAPAPELDAISQQKRLAAYAAVDENVKDNMVCFLPFTLFFFRCGTACWAGHGIRSL